MSHQKCRCCCGGPLWAEAEKRQAEVTSQESEVTFTLSHSLILLLQVGVGGDHRAAHAGAHVCQPADGWVCVGPSTGGLHQADRWESVVGAIWPQYLALLLLQRLHPTHSLAPAPGMWHHPPGKAADPEAAHWCYQPPSRRRRRTSVSGQQPGTEQWRKPRGKHFLFPGSGAVWKTGQQGGDRQVRMLVRWWVTWHYNLKLKLAKETTPSNYII